MILLWTDCNGGVNSGPNVMILWLTNSKINVRTEGRTANCLIFTLNLDVFSN
jgi:hypothetical protein